MRMGQGYFVVYIYIVKYNIPENAIYLAIPYYIYT